MEGELERQQQLNEGLQSDLARFNEREALLVQARPHPVQFTATNPGSCMIVASPLPPSKTLWVAQPHNS